MTDTLDVKLFSVHRSAPSKGYEVALFPGAPFGPEVVLSIRERDAEGLEAEVVVETPEDKSAFVSVIVGAVTVLMGLDTAREIAAAVYFHEMGGSVEANEEANQLTRGNNDVEGM